MKRVSGRDLSASVAHTQTLQRCRSQATRITKGRWHLITVLGTNPHPTPKTQTKCGRIALVRCACNVTPTASPTESPTRRPTSDGSLMWPEPGLVLLNQKQKPRKPNTKSRQRTSARLPSPLIESYPSQPAMMQVMPTVSAPQPPVPSALQTSQSWSQSSWRVFRCRVLSPISFVWSPTDASNVKGQRAPHISPSLSNTAPRAAAGVCPCGLRLSSDGDATIQTSVSVSRVW